METMDKVIKRMTYQDELILDWKTMTIQILKKKISPDELDAAHLLLSQNPEPMWIDKEHTRVEWDWMYAVALLDLQEKNLQEPDSTYFSLGRRML